ncbi:MAG: 4-hydroxy-2-oxovalerate aldolase [Coriobacteriia bacterium]|nr:4-hydroxy-2-oxovalerate aldolase [Coriobacteriia bacterium]
MKKRLLITDVSLRDGSHAVAHQLTAKQLADHAAAVEAAHVPVVEVGHGNGLGASSLQLGESLLGDLDMLRVVREQLTTARMSIHVIPGFATIGRDLRAAIDVGVDIIRVAAHCTEADITERHITFAREQGKEVYGVLMMSHMASKEVLLEEALKMEAYGAEGVVLMDSAGAYLPVDVRDKVRHLCTGLSIPVGFHAHNNLGLAIGNSLVAAESGAYILDGAIRGFGAGAGNAQLEALVAVMEKAGYETGIDLYGILDAGDRAQEGLLAVMPTTTSTSIMSGLSGVFSGFLKPVNRIAAEYGVDPRDVFFELGRRGVVAGQEDLILEVAQALAQQRGGRDV